MYVNRSATHDGDVSIVDHNETRMSDERTEVISAVGRTPRFTPLDTLLLWQHPQISVVMRVWGRQGGGGRGESPADRVK